MLNETPRSHVGSRAPFLSIVCATYYAYATNQRVAENSIVRGGKSKTTLHVRPKMAPDAARRCWACAVVLCKHEKNRSHPRPNPHSFLPAAPQVRVFTVPCLPWELLLTPSSAHFFGQSSFRANCDISQEWGHWTRKLNLAQFYSSHPLWRRLMLTILTFIYQTKSEVKDSQSFLYFAPRLLGLLSVLFLFEFWKVKNVKCKTN